MNLKYHHNPVKLAAGVVALVTGAGGSSALAQGLAISWFTIDGGGGRASGGTIVVHGTIGQAEAGPPMTPVIGGGLSVTGGFWVRPGAAGPACVADVDDGGGSGTPDGGVTIDDLLYYMVIYDQGVIRGDVDDGSGTGTRDGGVTIDDLLYYLIRFEAGC